MRERERKEEWYCDGEVILDINANGRVMGWKGGGGGRGYIVVNSLKLWSSQFQGFESCLKQYPNRVTPMMSVSTTTQRLKLKVFTLIMTVIGCYYCSGSHDSAMSDVHCAI